MSPLLDRDEGRHDAGRRTVMWLGAEHVTDDRRPLVDAMRPTIRKLAVIIIFPVGGAGIQSAYPPDRQNRRAAVLPDRPLQIEPAAGPVDRTFEGRGCRNLEREHGLGEQQCKQVLGRLVRIAGDLGWVVEEAAIGPFAGKDRSSRLRICHGSAPVSQVAIILRLYLREYIRK